MSASDPASLVLIREGEAGVRVEGRHVAPDRGSWRPWVGCSAGSVPCAPAQGLPGPSGEKGETGDVGPMVSVNPLMVCDPNWPRPHLLVTPHPSSPRQHPTATDPPPPPQAWLPLLLLPAQELCLAQPPTIPVYPLLCPSLPCLISGCICFSPGTTRPPGTSRPSWTQWSRCESSQPLSL